MNPDEVNIDQNIWVIQIQESVEKHLEQEEEKEMVASIFGVPKELFTMKPEAYVLQCVSIGPYHHWRSQLCEMESYKVAAARRFQKMLTGDCKFEYVVGEVKKYDWQIRKCYQKCLDYKEEEALAWLMALDTPFVLECLQFYTKGVDHSSSQLSSQLKRLGRSATHNAIMRDLMMLENQIPLFLLQKLLEIQLGCQDKADERLSNLVTLACEDWLPFMLKTPDSSRLCIKMRGHLLEVLYHSIVRSAVLDDTFTYWLHVFIHGKHIGMLPYQTHISSNCSPFLQMAMKRVMYIPPTRSPPHSGHFRWWSREQEAFLPK